VRLRWYFSASLSHGSAAMKNGVAPEGIRAGGFESRSTHGFLGHIGKIIYGFGYVFPLSFSCAVLISFAALYAEKQDIVIRVCSLRTSATMILAR
jgi:hypothetical protein